MKITLLSICSLFLISVAALSQTSTHAATLAWQDNLNPSGTTYNVYRATGLCSGTPGFSKIASALSEKTYEDTTVQPGNYCYTVTAVLNGMESAQSNWALAPVPSFPPQLLSVTVK
jgi:hypothetical protein